MDRFGGTIRGFVMGIMGMSSGGALGTVLEDSSLTTRAHSSTLRPISFVETRSTASSALATATVRLEVVRVGEPGCSRLAAGGADKLPGLFCSSPLVGVRTIRAVL